MLRAQSLLPVASAAVACLSGPYMKMWSCVDCADPEVGLPRLTCTLYALME